MEEWKEYSLGDIVNLVIDYRGKTPLKLGGSWSQNGYRALSAKNIKTGAIVNEDSIRFVDEELYRRWMKDEVQRGDIFVTSEAPFGQIYYWNSDEKIVLSQRLFCLRLSEEVCSKFVYYYMITNTFQAELDGRATGTTVIGLRQPELLKCKINLPSLAEQQRIASILSSLDEKIEVNRRINDNLEQQAMALFDMMFPAVASGEDIIGNVITPKRGKGLLSKDAVEGTVPVVAGGLEPATYHNESNTVAPVVTISASGANAGFVNLWQIPVWSSDSSFIDASMTENVYFWYVMLKKRQKEIFDAQTGSAQPHIYPKHIAEMPLGKFEQTDVEKFTEIVTPMFEIRGRNLKESERLASIRDTLLPKLMSGELKLENINM